MKESMYMFRRSIGISLFLMTALVSQRAYAAGTVVITPNNPNGWGFFQETPTGSGTFVSGPSTPPLGIGSAQFTVDGTGGEIFGTFAFAGTRLDAITSLGYSTYRVSGGSALAPSLQLDIDTDVTDANTSWQGRLVYEPYYTHTVSTGVWQTWNPLDNASAGNWWFSGAPGNTMCPMSNACTWSEVLADFPNAGVRSAGPNTGAVQFKAGGGWVGGFVGSVDSFSIGVNGVASVYDFDVLVPPAPATLHVIKLVVNGNGGTASSSDFAVHIKSATSSSDVAGSPQAGKSAPGTLYTLAAGTYAISEDAHSGYVQSFGTDCTSGSVTLAPGDDKICTIVNTDIPGPVPVQPQAQASVVGGGGEGYYASLAAPVISIIGIPTPFALPTGPGSVTYGYTVRNVSEQQTLVDVKVIDDKCGPVGYVSGDINGDGKLDASEGWKYSCTTALSTTTTNTAVVTGYSDNAAHLPAIATAISTVAVGGVPGLPNTGLLPPLINIIKVPDRLTPLPSGGGPVTYTYTVTNPGFVAMHDVAIIDDKCLPVSFISGDSNDNGLLDPGEVWIYTCRMNISIPTRNVATARGGANGFTTLGYAFATVLVSAPGLPNTGSVRSVRGSAQYKAGDQVTTIRGMNVRRTAGLGGDIVALEPKGATGSVLGVPESKNGHIWWQIRYSAGLTGWTAGVGLMKAP